MLSRLEAGLENARGAAPVSLLQPSSRSKSRARRPKGSSLKLKVKKAPKAKKPRVKKVKKVKKPAMKKVKKVRKCTKGSRKEVWSGKCLRTSYGKRGLTKSDLMLNKRGKIISKKAHAHAINLAKTNPKFRAQQLKLKKK